MEIYTFSGTGNSLHVAVELAARFPDASLVPIMSVLDQKAYKTRDEVVGMVFLHPHPCPILSMKRPFRQRKLPPPKHHDPLIKNTGKQVTITTESSKLNPVAIESENPEVASTPPQSEEPATELE